MSALEHQSKQVLVLRPGNTFTKLGALRARMSRYQNDTAKRLGLVRDLQR